MREREKKKKKMVILFKCPWNEIQVCLSSDLVTNLSKVSTCQNMKMKEICLMANPTFVESEFVSKFSEYFNISFEIYVTFFRNWIRDIYSSSFYLRRMETGNYDSKEMKCEKSDLKKGIELTKLVEWMCQKSSFFC